MKADRNPNVLSIEAVPPARDFAERTESLSWLEWIPIRAVRSQLFKNRCYCYGRGFDDGRKYEQSYALKAGGREK